MRKPRTNVLLLMTIFVIVGLIGQAWFTVEAESTALAAVKSEAISPPSAQIPPISIYSANASDATNSPRTPALRPVPLRLSDDASVLVNEMCALQLMAQGTDFTLDSGQWPAFAEVVLRFQAIRYVYEAQVATLHVITPGRYRVAIPVYAGAGAALREQFAAALRTELGEQTALDVLTKLGDRLEERFAEFGGSEQTLDISASPVGDPRDIQVTRTVQYGNRVTGSERLTTRRETHFPVLEDPTGDSWSSLLAMVVAAGAVNGPG